MIKYFGVLTLGAGLGGLVTWRLVKKHYENILDSELSEIQKHYEKKIIENIETDTASISVETFGSMLRQYGGAISESEKTKIMYNLATDDSVEHINDAEYADETDDEREAREAAYENAERQLSNTYPYVISMDEYSDECQHHHKLGLLYFADDDVLCDENEKTCDDYLYLIGEEAYQLLEDMDDDLNTTIWVRNEQLACDYEIVRVNHSYAEVVLGYGSNSRKNGTSMDCLKNEKKLRASTKRGKKDGEGE